MDMNRRSFIGGILASGSAPLLFNGCATGFLANSRVNVGVVGFGRIAHSMDIPLTLKHTGLCRFTAICDLDSKRRDAGVKFVQEQYRTLTGEAIDYPVIAEQVANAVAAGEYEKAILCCQAFHARRAFMTYAKYFPDTEILVVPTETQGIRRKDWYLQENSYQRVMSEVYKCGEYFLEYQG